MECDQKAFWLNTPLLQKGGRRATIAVQKL
jgi:hypothetical protein